jgi:hypothetical protein
MGLRPLRHALRIGAAAIFIVAAAQLALAGSGPAASSDTAKKVGASSAARHSAAGARHRHIARPAPHQATTRKEHKKDLASRPPTGSVTRPPDKSLDQRPLLGSFSLGVETEQYVKRRSIRGGDYDPDVDGEPKGYRPPYMGFSLKAPLSW